MEANASTLGLGGIIFYILEGDLIPRGGEGRGGCLHLTGGMDAPGPLKGVKYHQLVRAFFVCLCFQRKVVRSRASADFHDLGVR